MNTMQKTILIVEDNREYQYLLTLGHQRSNINCSVQLVDSAEKAQELLQGQELKPQLIILDCHLPGMSGIDFVKEIKASIHYRSIPILMFSIFASPELIDEAYQHGVNAFIPKPENLAGIVELWSDLLSFWITSAQLPLSD